MVLAVCIALNAMIHPTSSSRSIADAHHRVAQTQRPAVGCMYFLATRSSTVRRVLGSPYHEWSARWTSASSELEAYYLLY